MKIEKLKTPFLLFFLVLVASILAGTSFTAFARIQQNIAVDGSVSIQAYETSYTYERYYEELDGSFNLFSAETITAYSGQRVNGYTDDVPTGFHFDESHPDNIISVITAIDGSSIIRLYFARNIYSITYDFNDEITSDIIHYYKYGATPDILENPDRPGYNFAGWNASGEYGTVNENIILTAEWALASYTITYVFGSTNNSQPDSFLKTDVTNSNPVTYTIQSGFSFNNLSKNYYTFGGFYTDASYTNPISEITSNSRTGDLTIYVKWTAFSWTVKYNNNITNPNTSYIIFNFTGSPSDQVLIYDNDFLFNMSAYNVNCTGSGANITSQPTSQIPRAYIIGTQGGYLEWKGAAIGSNDISAFNSGATKYNNSGSWTSSGNGGSNATNTAYTASTFLSYAASNFSNNSIINLGAFWDYSGLDGNATCLAEGTLVHTSLTDTKPIEDIHLGENVLVWNFMTGAYDYSPVVYIEKGKIAAEMLILTFSNGRKLTICAEHALFCIEENKYISIGNFTAPQYTGKHFLMVENGEIISTELTNFTFEWREINVYSLVTMSAYNHFANGMLTAIPYVSLLNMFKFGPNFIYDFDSMMQDIEEYGLFDYSIWEQYLTPDQYLYFNAAYMKIAIEKELITFDEIVKIIKYYFEKGEVAEQIYNIL